MLLDSRINKRDVGDKSEQKRNTDYGGARKVEPWHYARHVHCQNHEEHARKQRHEALALFLAEGAIGDVRLNEANRHFEQALTATWDHSHATSAEPEQDNDERNRDKADDHQSVDLKRRAIKENGRRQEFGERRAVKAPIAGSVIGGKGR